MFLPRVGEGQPEVTLPTWSPPPSSTGVPWRAGGPASATSPTRFLLEPSRIWARTTSAPGKSLRSRRRLETNQVRAASTGVVSAVRSLPYRHNPASSLQEPLHYKPTVTQPLPQRVPGAQPRQLDLLLLQDLPGDVDGLDRRHRDLEAVLAGVAAPGDAARA
jgi:hypothetical protein